MSHDLFFSLVFTYRELDISVVAIADRFARIKKKKQISICQIAIKYRFWAKRDRCRLV